MTHDDTSFDAIFCGAIEIASAEDRAVYTARACGPDEGLRPGRGAASPVATIDPDLSTGRFAGATGGFTSERLFDTVSFTTIGSFEGSISSGGARKR